MKKCKSCGVPSKNKTYEGDRNPYNVEHCNVCAMILNNVDIIEVALNQPNGLKWQVILFDIPGNLWQAWLGLLFRMKYSRILLPHD